MKGIKNLCLRLPEEEYVAFDFVCREKGYSKTGKIRELIRKLVKEELESVKISARELSEIEKGIKEIDRGDYVTFEEQKRGLKKKCLENNNIREKQVKSFQR